MGCYDPYNHVGEANVPMEVHTNIQTRNTHAHAHACTHIIAIAHMHNSCIRMHTHAHPWHTSKSTNLDRQDSDIEARREVHQHVVSCAGVHITLSNQSIGFLK